SSRLPDGQTRNKLFNRTDPPFSKRSLPANQLPDVADKALRFAGGGFGDITDGDKEEEGDGKSPDAGGQAQGSGPRQLQGDHQQPSDGDGGNHPGRRPPSPEKSTDDRGDHHQQPGGGGDGQDGDQIPLQLGKTVGQEGDHRHHPPSHPELADGILSPADVPVEIPGHHRRQGEQNGV